MPKNTRLLKTIAQQSGEKFWEVRALAEQGGKKLGEVFIYGPIFSEKWWDEDVAPKALKEEIDALGDIDTLYVRINSPGGNVFAGHAIYNILRRVDAEVVVTIDGIAASAASVIAMAGDRIISAKNGMLMIHNAWTWAIGNSKELRKTADLLDQIQKTLVAVYQDKTGLPKDEIVAMLDEETWLTADEMLEKKFIDQIDETKEVVASIRDDKLVVNGREFDVSAFGVLPPFSGVENRQAAAEVAEPRSEPGPEPKVDRPSSALRRAFSVVARALGFDGEDREKVVMEITDDAIVLNDAQVSSESEASTDVEESEKGSGEHMGDVKNTAQSAPETPVAETTKDVVNMDPEQLMARLAELERRAQDAEAMARAERDKRVEAEFVKRVEAYGTLPMAATELGPIMKRASEAMSKEDFNEIENLLKAVGNALDQSKLFDSVGVSGDGDTSPLGQYRAELKKVKEANPTLDHASASLQAFGNLPADVQTKLHESGAEL